jgi:hypothetical protein
VKRCCWYGPWPRCAPRRWSLGRRAHPALVRGGAGQGERQGQVLVPGRRPRAGGAAAARQDRQVHPHHPPPPGAPAGGALAAAARCCRCRCRWCCCCCSLLPRLLLPCCTLLLPGRHPCSTANSCLPHNGTAAAACLQCLALPCTAVSLASLAWLMLPEHGPQLPIPQSQPPSQRTTYHPRAHSCTLPWCCPFLPHQSQLDAAARLARLAPLAVKGSPGST